MGECLVRRICVHRLFRGTPIHWRPLEFYSINPVRYELVLGAIKSYAGWRECQSSMFYNFEPFA